MKKCNLAQHVNRIPFKKLFRSSFLRSTSVPPGLSLSSVREEERAQRPSKKTILNEDRCRGIGRVSWGEVTVVTAVGAVCDWPLQHGKPQALFALHSDPS